MTNWTCIMQAKQQDCQIRLTDLKADRLKGGEQTRSEWKQFNMMLSYFLFHRTALGKKQYKRKYQGNKASLDFPPHSVILQVFFNQFKFSSILMFFSCCHFISKWMRCRTNYGWPTMCVRTQEKDWFRNGSNLVFCFSKSVYGTAVINFLD